MSEPMLSVENLHVYYGGSHVIKGASFTLGSGIITVVGRNGMGKTTIAKAIMGLVRPREGEIRFKGRSIVGLPPHKIAALGIGYVPQGRRVFTSLTVDEHLRFAARPSKQGGWTADKVYELFPRLLDRKNQSGTTLSGGEQQMLAIGRALVLNPSRLVMDEPSEGLAPVVVDQLISACESLVNSGMSILLIEQNLRFATAVAENTHVVVTGQVAYNGSIKELLSDQDLTRRYLGVGV